MLECPSFPVVFLPGVLNTAALWQPMLDRLSARVMPFHAEIHQHDEMESIVKSILPQLPERFALAGFSMGGYVALELLRQAPGRVERLALINSKALPDNVAQHRQRQLILQATRNAEDHQFVGVTPRLYRRLVGRACRDNQDIAKRVFMMAKQVGRKGFIHQQQANLTRKDTSAVLRQYAQPVLLLSGSEDQIVLPEETFAITPSGPQRQCLLEGVGHLSPLEAAEAVSQALWDWLSL